MTPPSASSIPGARKVAGRLDRAVRWRVDEQIGQHLAHVHQRIDDLGRRLDEQAKRLDEFGPQTFWTAEEMRRVAPQVAALDVRMEDLRQRLEAPAGSPEEIDQARSVVDEVRREHDRVKARLSSVSWYEDRIRKLEDQVKALGAAVE